MNGLGIIIEREFMTRVRRRAFWMGTLLGPVLIFALMAFGVWVGESSTDDIKALVADESGLITHWDGERNAWMPNCSPCFPKRDQMVFRFAQETLSDSAFLGSDFDVMVQFDDGILQHGKAMMYYERSPGVLASSNISRDLSEAIERLRVQRESALDYETYKRLKTSVSLVGQDIVTRDGGALGRGIIGFIFSLFLFIQLLIYGMHVMRGVIEEKANRIVEVVISAVRPAELLAGKVIGIGLVGLTQFLLFALLGGLVTAVGGEVFESSGMFKLPDSASGSGEALSTDLSTWMAAHSELSFLLDVNWGLMILVTVLFYAAGFALFAAMFAAVGSMVEQESDAQYLMLPVMVPLMGSYMLAAFAIENPEGMMSIVGSWFPFTAPVLMLIRLPLGVPWWEVLLSWLGVVITAWGIIVLAGRIYRVGILMYGKRPTLQEIWRWMRHS